MSKYLNFIKKSVKEVDSVSISRSGWESSSTLEDIAQRKKELMDAGYNFDRASPAAPDDSYYEYYTKPKLKEEEAVKIVKFLQKHFDM
jgi:hypothetical protein